METREIPINSIRVSNANVRKDLQAGTEDVGLRDLANSIRENGLISPITVKPLTGGLYDLVIGQRRFLACRDELGWDTIAATVREGLDDTTAVVISLVENVQRADMAPIDKAKAFQGIYSQYGDYNRVAKETGVTTQTIRKYLLLLNLAPSLQDHLTTNDGPAGIGALSQLANTFDDPDEQEGVWEQISGLKQSLQQDIIRRSGGDLGKVPELKDEVVERDLNMRMCREGLCFTLPAEVKSQIMGLLREGKEFRVQQ